jgi:hypothetical protein
VLRSSCGLARIALERNRIDLPVEMLVPRDDAALSVQLDDFAADRDALFLRAVPVGVVEDRLDPAGLLTVAHCPTPSSHHLELRITGPDPRRLEQPFERLAVPISRPAALPPARRLFK